MALTANTLPSIVPELIVPLDVNMQFAGAQTIAATGYVNNVNQQLDVGPGRLKARLAVNVTALDQVTGDETYRLFLMGSNDVNWGNGNVENLASYDYGAAANRIVAAILGSNTSIPPAGRAGQIDVLPFVNLRQRIVYRYLRLYAVLAGTTPSITLSAWIAPEEVCQG